MNIQEKKILINNEDVRLYLKGKLIMEIYMQ